MKYKPLPSQEYLKECFDYDEETGILTWKERPKEHFQNVQHCNNWNKIFSNKIIGNLDKSNTYVKVRINIKHYYIHRIIWKLVTGNDPINIIDHINGNKKDNRFCNLREADKNENQHNRTKQKIIYLDIKEFILINSVICMLLVLE